MNNRRQYRPWEGSLERSNRSNSEWLKDNESAMKFSAVFFTILLAGMAFLFWRFL